MPRPTDLTDSHKRGISITLTMLDEALCRVEQWAGGQVLDSLLFVERNELTEHQRQDILAEVAKIRFIVERMKADFAIKREMRSVARMIASLCSTLWEDVAELDSRHLKRYGELPDGLADHIDPDVSELLEGLKRISDISIPSQSNRRRNR